MGADARDDADRLRGARSDADEAGRRRLGVGSTVYAFGSPCDQFYGRLVFRADGTIAGYSHPNESRWTLADGVLTFLNKDGAPTSRYTRDGGSGCWLGTASNSKWPLVLVPLLSHEHPARLNLFYPPVLINSIPKSGTYYMEAAFAELGWRPTRFHLGSGGLHDYRGESDEVIHSAPARDRLLCPAECIVAILKPGDIAVGHIDAAADLKVIRSYGVFDLFLIRNLRDVIVSLCNFKLRKVAPVSLGDRVWRQVAEAERFTAFLAFYADKDIEFVKSVARAVLDESSACIVRFEDMLEGSVRGAFRDRLDALDIGLSGRLEAALRAKLRTSNPTYSGRTADWRTVWDDRAERFFDESGLRALNAELGYESTAQS